MGSARRALFAILVCLLAWCGFARAESAARIRQTIDSRQMTRLRGGVYPLARPEFDQGALDPSQVVHRIKLVFNRSAAQQQALDRLLEEQQDPSSANYHNWLTPEQFAARFGMSDLDLLKAGDWLVSRGFTVDEVARGRNYVTFSGAVSDINSAFRTEMHQYDVRGEVHFANATPLSVPSALAPVVAGIRSLNDFKPNPRAKSRRVNPDLTSSATGSHFLVPDDFGTIYNLNALYAAGINGTGQKLAVMGQTDLYSSGGDPAFDITTFRNDSNLSANPPQIILIPGPDPGLSTKDIGEASLDVEWSGAVARNAQIIYVNAGTSGGVFDSLYYAIDNNTAPVITISYGICESQEYASGYLSADESELQKAAAQGQTVVGPGGDSGAADCDTNYPVTDALDVDYPASSQYVTGVGGTTFSEPGGVTFWSSVNNVYNGSALFYVPEVVWNDSACGSNGCVLSSTGGGASSQFAKPSWQSGAGVPPGNHRYVPDVAFAASPGHDGYITCSQGDCQICITTDANCPTATSPGYRLASDQTFDVVGGTSAGAPTFAGLVALLNQQTGSTQGNMNTKLYQLAGSASYVFHDITSGNNNVQCSSGPTCPSGGGTIGYSAGVGYDPVTGLGSPDGFNLVENWNSTASPDFGLSFFNPSIYVPVGNSANAIVIVRKQNGFSGMVSLTCSSSLPAVTCSISPATVTPDATATVTITASASAALHPPAPPFPVAPWWAAGFGVAAMFGTGRITKKRIAALLLAVVLVALASCGGIGVKSNTTSVLQSGTTHNAAQNTSPTQADSSTSVTPSRPDRGPRPPQTYVTVQATSGNLTHTTQVLVAAN